MAEGVWAVVGLALVALVELLGLLLATTELELELVVELEVVVELELEEPLRRRWRFRRARFYIGSSPSCKLQSQSADLSGVVPSTTPAVFRCRCFGCLVWFAIGLQFGYLTPKPTCKAPNSWG